MPDNIIIDICKTLIEKNSAIHSLFKPELKNTIANVYYKEVQALIEDGETDLNENDDLNKIQSKKIDQLIRMVKSLKEIQEKERKKEVKYITQLILDEMKYDIKDAHKLSEFSRTFKRLLRKNKVGEIKDLYRSFE